MQWVVVVESKLVKYREVNTQRQIMMHVTLSPFIDCLTIVIYLLSHPRLPLFPWSGLLTYGVYSCVFFWILNVQSLLLHFFLPFFFQGSTNLHCLSCLKDPLDPRFPSKLQASSPWGSTNLSNPKHPLSPPLERLDKSPLSDAP